ncbi:MAG: hypothetical protein Q4F49_02850 [Pseudoxanthomonas suwonensis]|nr:hypothetical protein [Pseudoxanthomonas suwonensis]
MPRTTIHLKENSMIRNRMTLAVATVLLGSVAMVGCKKEEPVVTTPPPASTPAPAPTPAPASVNVTAVDLGTAIGADGRVSAPATTFGVNDTVYVSVSTDGTASGNALTARFSFQDGQEVAKDTRTLSTSGPAVTEFHTSKPDGWPVGNYKVEVSLDGNVVQTREYSVQ